jgi:ribosomal protein S18 acetylase RimI-like enzyme
MAEVTIRRIVLKDVPVLAEMARKTFYDTFTGTCTEEDMAGFLESYFNKTQVTKELSDPEDYFFFAEVDGVPAGYLRFKEDYRGLPLMKQWKTMELKRIYVLSEYHGQGIAQKLMDFLIDWCKNENYEAVYLGVWEHNIRAQKFYAKYGFENSGHTHDFPIGNTPQTDIWLWKFLELGFQD